MDVQTLNPYGLQEGQPCDTIRISYLPKDAPKQEVVVALPVTEGTTMQDVATEAFLYAKQLNQLSAGLMAVCGFSYRDDEQEAWIAFDPADY